MSDTLDALIEEECFFDKKKGNCASFHRIALEEFIFAMYEGKHMDSDYVKKKALDRYGDIVCEQARRDRAEEKEKSKIVAAITA